MEKGGERKIESQTTYTLEDVSEILTPSETFIDHPPHSIHEQGKPTVDDPAKAYRTEKDADVVNG